jgi:hypothetical protein
MLTNLIFGKTQILTKVIFDKTLAKPWLNETLAKLKFA